MKYLLILLIAITAMSCGAPATEDPVEKAAAALASGDEKSCQKACDALLSDTAAFNSLSAMQLCRLAELFVLLPGEPARQRRGRRALPQPCPRPRHRLRRQLSEFMLDRRSRPSDDARLCRSISRDATRLARRRRR